jgi:hypothetical protein
MTEPAFVNISTPAAWPYALPRRALEKWAREHVTIIFRPDDSVAAQFRFTGSTCSNLGHPIKMIFSFILSPRLGSDRTILDSNCRPAPDDSGCPRMCSMLESPESFQTALEYYAPLTGKTLSEALAWNPDLSVAGCLCHRSDQNHKWRNAIQTVHFALSSPAIQATP